MNYDVDYFIKKFEVIPEEGWCMNEFRIGDAMCANGHCGLTNEFQVTDESMALREMFLKLPLHYLGNGYKIDGTSGKYSINAAMVNDGRVEEYQQPTPKQRILAALYDIKKMQEPKDTVKKEPHCIRIGSGKHNRAEQRPGFELIFFSDNGESDPCPSFEFF